MGKLTTKAIKIIMIISFIIVYFIVNIMLEQHSKRNFKVSLKQITNLTNTETIENTISDDNKSKLGNNFEKNNQEQKNWRIIIPEISLNAEINEGTSKETMDKYVGHFEETKLEYGNIGLAAHNRGYLVNYFQNLKHLKKGSEITYIHNDFEMLYVVEKIEIIENTNWEYLKNTEDNRITLITCVENEPKYRRCIQGVEI